MRAGACACVWERVHEGAPSHLVHLSAHEGLVERRLLVLGGGAVPAVGVRPALRRVRAGRALRAERGAGAHLVGDRHVLARSLDVLLQQVHPLVGVRLAVGGEPVLLALRREGVRGGAARVAAAGGAPTAAR